MATTLLRKHGLTLAITAAVFAQCAQAQDAAGVLDTVQVTADRRVENIQDVPVSVSTVSGENLNALASSGADVRFLSGRVPSLNIESSFGRAFPRFYIRGYGNSDFRLNTSQPVSLVYDDVVQENPILKGFPVFDVDQVEVLRGPQGTLFGRNSPAGVVKFNSVKPTEEVTGYGKLSLASYGGVNAEGAIGGGLGEGWSTRISAQYQHRDDFVDNTFTGEKDAYEGYDEFAARAQLRYANEDFEALFNVHVRDLEGTARLFRANMIQAGTNKPVAGFDRNKIAIDGQNEQNLNQFGANARLRWDFDGFSVHSITGYESVDTFSRGDIDGGFGAAFLGPGNSGPGFIPFASESADGIPEHSQLTQEFRIESKNDSALNWQAGLFYFDEDYKVESFSYDSLFTQSLDGYQRIRQTNNSWAVFGAINWDVSENFELRAGARYTVDNKELTVEDYWNTGFVPCFLLGKCTLAQLAAQEPDGDLSASPEDKKFSWDLSGIWKLNEDVNLYARIATGYRGSSIQSAGAFNAKSVASPETSTSFEFGIKADFWDKRARLNANVFYYEVKDQQLTAVGGSGNANILLNAEKSVGQGFELDFQAYLTDNLLVTLGTGYNDTEIQDENLAVSVCAQCTVTDPIVDPLVDPIRGGKALINGNALPQAPKWSHNVTARWSMPAGDGGEFYVFTDWVYRSEVNFFLYESVEFVGDSMLEGGLRLGYSWDNGSKDVALYGRNITDELVILAGIDFNNLTGMVNEPRTVGVEFKAGF